MIPDVFDINAVVILGDESNVSISRLHEITWITRPHGVLGNRCLIEPARDIYMSQRSVGMAHLRHVRLALFH
jgi:hypothetical protein